MMNPYKMFGNDKTLEAEKGIALDYGDFQIRVARAGGSNSNFARMLRTKLKPYKRQVDLGTMDDAVAQKILAEVYAESVILGWSGVTDTNGDVLEFNTENAVKLLLDLPDLFTDIQRQAENFTNFRQAELEDEVKN